MTPASIAVRVVAAVGVMLIVAALAYSLSHGRVFLFPFLILLGIPMAAVFRTRPPAPPGDASSDEPKPPRISLN